MGFNLAGIGNTIVGAATGAGSNISSVVGGAVSQGATGLYNIGSGVSNSITGSATGAYNYATSPQPMMAPSYNQYSQSQQPMYNVPKIPASGFTTPQSSNTYSQQPTQPIMNPIGAISDFFGNIGTGIKNAATYVPPVQTNKGAGGFGSNMTAVLNNIAVPVLTPKSSSQQSGNTTPFSATHQNIAGDNIIGGIANNIAGNITALTNTFNKTPSSKSTSSEYLRNPSSTFPNVPGQGWLNATINATPGGAAVLAASNWIAGNVTKSNNANTGGSMSGAPIPPSGTSPGNNPVIPTVNSNNIEASINNILASNKYTKKYSSDSMNDAAANALSSYKSRKDYTDVYSLGDQFTQGLADKLMNSNPGAYDRDTAIAIVLEGQRDLSNSKGKYTEARFFDNELSKSAQNDVALSSQFHHQVKDAGISVPFNPFEVQGDKSMLFVNRYSPNTPRRKAKTKSTVKRDVGDKDKNKDGGKSKKKSAKISMPTISVPDNFTMDIKLPKLNMDVFGAKKKVKKQV